ncbi:hypothetical protein [Streptomyces sp. ML-6]|uniref:hypothetical protein n=1 Tax=Streptomyces sp. ML-6 TaxID=2982693 RepID=UPI0024C06901|nr:hypothetical protein [Streptomyces sp. ML-6]MDK0525056.1 hypothetical protein [Streptomyces sp. ML-6]
MSARAHGTYVKYKLDGCRCYPCCWGEAQYRANRARAIAYGTWQPYVDAEPVRAHVKTLSEFGIGWMRLARLASVPRGTVSKLLYGDPSRGMSPSKRLLPKNATALLSIEPTLDNLGAAARIDGTGTRRRLQALVAAGWPQVRLADGLGIDRGNFGKTVHGDQQVKASTARAAMALYDQLWRADPRAHGVRPHVYDRTRHQAAEAHWAPVGAWDDDTIDDPTAYPDWTGRCGTPDGCHEHYRLHIPVCAPCRQARAEHRAQLRSLQAA